MPKPPNLKEGDLVGVYARREDLVDLGIEPKWANVLLNTPQKVLRSDGKRVWFSVKTPFDEQDTLWVYNNMVKRFKIPKLKEEKDTQSSETL